jgi:hypothetical protein
MERVSFIPPVSSDDLRVVLTNHTAAEHDHYSIAFRTQYGETRKVRWLTYGEAIRRAALLRGRGYSVNVAGMDI